MIYCTYILYILCIYVWTYIQYIKIYPSFLLWLKLRRTSHLNPSSLRKFSEPSKQQTLPRYSKERDQVDAVEQLPLTRLEGWEVCFKPAWENVETPQNHPKVRWDSMFLCFLFQTSTVGSSFAKNCFMELSSVVFRLEILAKSDWHALSLPVTTPTTPSPRGVFWNLENDEVFQVLNPNLFQKVLILSGFIYTPWN